MFQVFTQVYAARQLQMTELDGNGTPQMDMCVVSLPHPLLLSFIISFLSHLVPSCLPVSLSLSQSSSQKDAVCDATSGFVADPPHTLSLSLIIPADTSFLIHSRGPESLSAQMKARQRKTYFNARNLTHSSSPPPCPPCPPMSPLHSSLLPPVRYLDMPGSTGTGTYWDPPSGSIPASASAFAIVCPDTDVLSGEACCGGTY
eukprot:2479956-Rhodomonas_salina.2